MKKILLTIASFALAIAVNAQVSVTQQNLSVIENNPNMTQRQHSQVVAKAPKKIASNQRWWAITLRMLSQTLTMAWEFRHIQARTRLAYTLRSRFLNLISV